MDHPDWDGHGGVLLSVASAWDNWDDQLQRLNKAWMREATREQEAREKRLKLEAEMERLSMRMRINNRQRWLAKYGPKG